ncbi:MAG TPA: Crp/Fnr family transcriptional regulator [Hyphomicrobiaceae bacterium]|nr:Crp/Fnr family transcriptional regulator [Hyphomicrobiaceae bacterium]
MRIVSTRDAWTGIANCRTCAVRQSVLFAGLEESDFNRIHRPIEQFSYLPGTTVYRSEESADWVYTIRVGLVKLLQYLPDGTQRIVRLMRTSDAIGLEGLVGARYEHHAIALHQTEVCRIPLSVVRELLAHKPAFSAELMARWQRALSESERVIRELNTGTARGRVVRLLLWLAESQGEATCDLFGREDLGALLGLTTETVSRSMAELKRQGHIIEPRSNQFVCDVARLRSLVE